jgi:hypothetical protein
MTGGGRAPLLLPLVLGWAAATASTLALAPLVGQLDSPVDVQPLMWLATAIAPLAQFGKALAFALVLWAVLVLVGRETELLPLWSVLLFGEALIALDGLLLAGWMHATPSSAWIGLEGLATPFTLGSHLALAQVGWGRLLEGFSALHLAWGLWVFRGLLRSVALPAGIAGGLALLLLTLRLAAGAVPSLVGVT